MIKVSIIGSGAIGSNIAYMLAQKKIYDIYLIDKPGSTVAEGKALDLMQCLSIQDIPLSYDIKGSNDIASIKRSDVIVITAGLTRRPDMTRSDLMLQNAAIISSIAQGVKKYAKDALVIMVTNPLDSMCWHFQKISDCPENKVIGMAGVLDSGRFRYFLSKHFKTDIRNIQAMVMGSHDDQMIPSLHYTYVNGVSLNDYIKQGRVTQEEMSEIIQLTKKAGGQIVSLLKDKSAYFAPAAGVINILESYVLDQKRMLPCSVNLNMLEAENDVFIGMPVVIGGNGVEEVCDLKLSAKEEEGFRQSIDMLMKQNVEISFSAKKAVG